MKNKWLVLALATGIFCSCNSTANNTATDAATAGDSATATSDTSGWVSLLDGKSTTGWHSYGKATAGQSWKVADGILYLDTTKKTGWQTEGGDLVTDAEYENFHLKLEWKIAPNGNSGIIFFINEDTSKHEYVWYTGPEMQILHNEGHSDGKITKHRAGDLYDLIQSKTEPVKPPGEWNEAEIVANKGKLDLFLNGTNIVSTTMWDSSWNKLISGSKFKEMPDFAKYKKGKIALQDHGDLVSFRNIRIKQL